MHRVIHREKPKADAFKSLSTEFYQQNPDVDTATISIVANKPKRSDSQNRLYWTWVDIIAKEIGYSKQEMHLLLADQFLERIEFTSKKGKEISQIPSTRGLNIEQFVDYLCEIDMMAGEYNMKLPHGSDYEFAVMGKRT